MFAKMCHQPVWTNMQVTIVHGRERKPAGCNPRRKVSPGAIRVAINSRKFTAIRINMGLSLKRW
jgi:hypothetical protein